MGEDTLLRLARDLLCQTLIHLRRDRNVLGDLVLPWSGALALPVARVVGAELPALAFELHALDRQRAETEGVAEGGGCFFKGDDAFGVGLFVDAVDGGHAEALVPVSDAL